MRELAVTATLAEDPSLPTLGCVSDDAAVLWHRIILDVLHHLEETDRALGWHAEPAPASVVRKAVSCLHGRPVANVTVTDRFATGVVGGERAGNVLDHLISQCETRGDRVGAARVRRIVDGWLDEGCAPVTVITAGPAPRLDELV